MRRQPEAAAPDRRPPPLRGQPRRRCQLWHRRSRRRRCHCLSRRRRRCGRRCHRERRLRRCPSRHAPLPPGCCRCTAASSPASTRAWCTGGSTTCRRLPGPSRRPLTMFPDMPPPVRRQRRRRRRRQQRGRARLWATRPPLTWPTMPPPPRRTTRTRPPSRRREGGACPRRQPRRQRPPPCCLRPGACRGVRTAAAGGIGTRCWRGTGGGGTAPES
ncbi:hypothetical protein I4F81_003612 [Pyropia yezoensis]|uniref:Uncharacterized protein n=1 Tax=Pyropia yezoensis TaxID=2788 RepID=A0ACC3BTV6_PYRYE|nr:hypothetical protein I4F81_003612 [Neopyropia yezoensis]